MIPERGKEVKKKFSILDGKSFSTINNFSMNVSCKEIHYTERWERRQRGGKWEKISGSGRALSGEKSGETSGRSGGGSGC
jgi:hypothetical protein